jgi:hypothetical protein
MGKQNQLSIIVSAFVIIAALVSACAPSAAATPSGNASRPTLNAPDVSVPTKVPAAALTSPAATNSNPPGNSANAAGRDPCSLLTKDEASQVLAQPVTNVKTEFGTCFYVAADQIQVGVAVSWSGGVTLLKSDREMFPDAQQIPGLGDEALFTRDGRLEVRKGDAAFTISSTIAVTPDKLDKLKAAATKMVSRLP